MASKKTDKTGNTRISYTSDAIKRDFAEHLKYTQDADVFHASMQGRYDALALSVRDRIIRCRMNTACGSGSAARGIQGKS